MPKVEADAVSLHLAVKGRLAMEEDHAEAELLREEIAGPLHIRDEQLRGDAVEHGPGRRWVTRLAHGRDAGLARPCSSTPGVRDHPRTNGPAGRRVTLVRSASGCCHYGQRSTPSTEITASSNCNSSKGFQRPHFAPSFVAAVTKSPLAKRPPPDIAIIVRSGDSWRSLAIRPIPSSSGMKMSVNTRSGRVFLNCSKPSTPF